MWKLISQKVRIYEKDWARSLLDVAKFFQDDVYTRTADLHNNQTSYQTATDICVHGNCVWSYILKH